MNDSRIDEILAQITKMASGDFNISPVISENHDEIDGILLGLEMLAEELKNSTISLENYRIEKEKAEIAIKVKSEFLTNMSHEVRTPLNAIIGFTDLIMKTILDESQKKYINIIYKSANSLLGLLNDILDFSKLEVGNLELNYEKTNLIELMNQAIAIIQIKANNKGLNLILNISPDVPKFIWTDQLRLKQILKNLLNNAVKFTEKGEIEFIIKIDRFFPESNTIELIFIVKDTGIGISKEYENKIFDAFSQEDFSTTRKFGGAGLGLTISNKLLELMKSNLKIKTEQGKGSEFFFNLIVKYEKEKRTIDLDNKQIVFPNKLKILIVDDDEINRFLAKNILILLIPNGIIFEANDGLEAIESFKKETQDIILMDMQMPNLGGYDATIEIRKLENGKDVKIIAFTAGTLKKDIEKCFQAGMNDFANKPIVRGTYEKILSQWFNPVISQ